MIDRFMLKLFFLGPPRVERNGRIVEMDTRKATALLAYLALSGERLSRDGLAALLWPDLDDSRARAALRRTLSTLKRAVGTPHLYATREVIGLETAGTWCDVLDFRRLLEADEDPVSLRQAIDLYREDFLAGFSLRDSLPFDDWQLLEAQNLRRGLESGLEKLGQIYMAAGAYEEALPIAQRWLQLDPLREAAHVHLMRLYAALGRRDAAMRQYRDCVRILAEELGVAPLPETTELLEAIQHNQLPQVVRPAPPSPVPRQAPGALPFIGRQAELAWLNQGVDALGPDGRVQILLGEVGIGKTRLVETFLAGRPAVRRLVTRCYEGEQTLAYAPILQALGEALDWPDSAGRLAAVESVWLAEAARLLPRLADFQSESPLEEGDALGAQSRFFEGLTQVFAALLGGGQPGFFWIDDAHWADAASLDLLAYMTRRLHQAPYLLLLTAREEDLPAGHPLHTLLVEVRRRDPEAILALGRLGPREVAKLVEAVDAPPAIADRLYEETDGLPSFIVAYLASLPELEGDEAWALPRTVRNLLRDRLVGIGEAGLQLLQTAAAIGRAFDVELLQRASGRGEEEIVTALEDLLARRILIEQDGQPTFDFNIDRLRQIVYEETRLVRRRLLHRRLATAFEEKGRRQRTNGLAAQVAHHQQLAGLEEEAAANYQIAGDHARALFANREALAHYQAALALGHPDQGALHEACGDLLTLQGDYGAARLSYETAASLADKEALGRLEHKLGQLYLRQGEWDLAEQKLRQASRWYAETAPQATMTSLYIDWSYSAYRQQQLDRAWELAFRGRVLADTRPDTLALAQSNNILGILSRHKGDLQTAIGYLEYSCRMAREAEHLPAQVAGLNNLALTYAANGETAEAELNLQKALGLCRRYGDHHYQAAILNNLADLYHQTGREEEAMAYLKEAVTLYAEVDGEAETWQPEIWKLTEW